MVYPVEREVNVADDLQWCSLRQLDVSSGFNPNGAAGIGGIWRATCGGAVVGFELCLPAVTTLPGLTLAEPVGPGQQQGSPVEVLCLERESLWFVLCRRLLAIHDR